MTEGTYPKIDGDILYSSEVNLFEENRWNPLVYVGTSIVGILAHSATAWTAYNGTSTFITADAGVSWTAASVDIADMTGVSRVSKANNALAICCDHDSANVSISSDSGDNWASASTDPGGTRVFSLSFPTATVAVCGMDEGTTRDIYYSTDAGDNWTVCDTGPTDDVSAIDMVDGSDGIALDVTGKIWTTSNGGVDWADSGQTSVVTPSTTTDMIALTSSTGVILNNLGTGTIETFTTAAGGTIRLRISDAGEAGAYLSNLIKTTNGNLYFVYYMFAESNDRGVNVVLYKSEDSGVTWAQKSIGTCHFENETDLTNYQAKSQLVEYDTNKLLIQIGVVQLMTINESGV